MTKWDEMNRRRFQAQQARNPTQFFDKRGCVPLGWAEVAQCTTCGSPFIQLRDGPISPTCLCLYRSLVRIVEDNHRVLTQIDRSLQELTTQVLDDSAREQLRRTLNEIRELLEK